MSVLGHRTAVYFNPYLPQVEFSKQVPGPLDQQKIYRWNDNLCIYSIICYFYTCLIQQKCKSRISNNDTGYFITGWKSTPWADMD